MTDTPQMQFGKYLLLEKIAVGGMAELYRARITGSQGFKKPVAIKKLLPHLTDEADLVDAFINEAKLAALLQHPSIVQIFDFGNMESTYFIAMEYLRGKDLRQMMDRAGECGEPLPLDQVLYIASRICDGLEYAHKMKDLEGKPLNIIHRDISPQNILVTYDGGVKIVDFGIAKAAGKNTKTKEGIIKGKVAYMSPEQASGKAIDRRSDIFSAGILLYEMLMGRQMFRGDAMEILALVREAKFDAPEELGRPLPLRLREILDRALAREPEDRYQSCGEMLSDLEECLYQEDLRPTPRGLARSMRDLFHQEIAAEEQSMRDSLQIRINGEPEGEGETRAPRKPLEKTRELSLYEIPGKPAGKRSWMGLAAGAAAVIAGLLFANAFWDLGLSSNHKGAALFGKEVPPAQSPAETAPNPRPAGQPSAAGTGRNPSRLGEAKVAFQPPQEGVQKPAESKAEDRPDRLGMVTAALEGKRFEEAVTLSEAAMAAQPSLAGALAPMYAEALVGQAVSLAEKDPGEAKSLLIKAGSVDPRNKRVYFEMGSIYVREKNYPDAIRSYRKVAEMDPGFTEAFFNLAYVYAKVKDYPHAEETYRRVVDMSPPYVDEALFNLAMVQERLGKTAESIENLERTLSANPANETARRYLVKFKKELRKDP